MQSRRPLIVLFSVVIVDLIGFGIVVPVLPFYADEFGASASVLGLLVASYAAMQFVFAPVWGRVSDRVGRRRVMLATIAGSSGALLVLGLAPSLGWLFVARILGGVFGANLSVASAYIADVTDEAERTRWMGMLGACFAVGFSLGPLLGGLLAPYGLGVPMLVAAGLAAVNCVYAAFVLKEPAQHVETALAGATVRRSRRDVLGDVRVRAICRAYLFFSLAVTQLETIFALLMMDRFGYDARDVAFILVLMAAVMGGIQGGGIRPLVARFGERKLVVAGSVLMAAGFAAIPLAPSVGILLVPLVVSAVGRGICQPAMMGMVSSYATPATRGAVMGSFTSRASLARVIGPVAAGLLFDQSLGAPFWLAAVLLFVSIAWTVGLPARVGQESEQLR